MLRSCQYCGRYHEDRVICPQKQAAIDKRAEWLRIHNKERRQDNQYPSDTYEYRKDKPEYKFRRGTAWTKRSKQVRERDHYLCLCCEAGLKGTVRRYNDGSSDPGGLQVHHIIPIKEDPSLRLDETNLITVCQLHHHLCEIGTISRGQQQALARSSIDKTRTIGVQGF